MLKRFSVCIVVLAGLATFSFAADESQNACKGDPDKWQQLFNGKDLTGWKHVGPGGDTVEDGLIRTHGGMGLLYWTAGKIGNCQIHVVYKMRDENDNSGVFIRIPIEPREEWMPVNYGFEVQIDNHPETSKEDEYHSTGMLYSLTNRWPRPGSPARSGTRWTSRWMGPAPSSCSME
jgi:hypothetical protein